MIKAGIILSVLLFIPIDSHSGVKKFTSDGVELVNTISITDSKGKSAFILADQTYNKSESDITDISLSFNSPSSLLVKDDTDKYNIHNAVYNFVKGNGVLGSGGAKFFKVNHRVEIDSNKNLWLGRCGDLGSFTIEFRFSPVSLNDESLLFSRVGYLSGEKNGIDIVIKGNRVSARLFKMFKDNEGRRYNVFLNKGTVLKKRKWHHFILSFDRISGKLTKCLNGEEEEVVYITESGDPFIRVYEPSFSCDDLPVAIIGKNYYGYIDEFRISYCDIKNLKEKRNIAYRNYKAVGIINRSPANREGLIISPVYSFPSTGTSVSLFKWGETIKENTFVWMEFRISDSLFLRDDRALKWYRIDNNQKNIYLKRTGNEYLRGKYYQWKAHLIPSSDGKLSPSIYDIELHYIIDAPPKPPLFVEVVKEGDRYVRLRWKKNVEYDISGYRIYYGLKSRRYDGVLGYINNKRISNGFNNDSAFIEVDITNTVIDENMRRHRSGILSFPMLNNSVLYFFCISANDSYKPDTIYNHESNLSHEVSARPFAGSEISQ